MYYKTNTFTATDGEKICYYKWDVPSGIPFRGLMQIAHGLGEHSGRYDHIAHLFQQEGFAVYANDHRAHGKTAEIKRMYGFYDGDEYFDDVVDDMQTLTLLMKREYPNAKFVLFGHSMGSLMSRKYVLSYGNEIDALILSGTANFIKGLGHVALIATKTVTAFKGRAKGNETLRAFFFDKFNEKFKPNRTKLDWISSDNAAVDLFEADPYRIENFSMSVFADFVSNLKALNKSDAFKNTPDNLPILIFSGDKDPVGDMGLGVTKVVENFKKYSNEDITFHLYEGGRHEMINEKNSQQVKQDIMTWLNEQIPK